jgi:hypothetical protein
MDVQLALHLHLESAFQPAYHLQPAIDLSLAIPNIGDESRTDISA